MNEVALNRFAKVLAAIGGLGIFFAIVAISAIFEGCEVADGGFTFGSSCSSQYHGAELTLGTVSLVIAIMAILTAVHIRRRLGGPLIGPWRGMGG